MTGAGGYVGSQLVPKLLDSGYIVKAHDLFIFGANVLSSSVDHPNLTIIKGDIRDAQLLGRTLPGADALIHLACISNDPSFELDPNLGKSINYDAFIPLVKLSKDAGIRRFIYASSSSVYGVKKEEEVTEELQLEPLTDYSKYKALCEEVLLKHCGNGFTSVILRPATLCGYAPRLRLDLTVNILTNHAINNKRIKVFGGSQTRPNLHIEDMTNIYLRSLEWKKELVNGKIFNAGYQNYQVRELANIVQQITGNEAQIEILPSSDQRSYRISSKKMANELSFYPAYSIEDAVKGLIPKFGSGLIVNPLKNKLYYNVDTMKQINMR